MCDASARVRSSSMIAQHHRLKHFFLPISSHYCSSVMHINRDCAFQLCECMCIRVMNLFSMFEYRVYTEHEPKIKRLTMHSLYLCCELFSFFFFFIYFRLRICHCNRYCHCDATFVTMFTQSTDASWEFLCEKGIKPNKNTDEKWDAIQNDAIPHVIVSFPFNLFKCGAPVQQFNMLKHLVPV